MNGNQYFLLKSFLVKEVLKMATMLRTIFVNAVDKTAKVNAYQLTFFVDTVLSNPVNKRYSGSFEGKNIKEVFDFMVSTLQDHDLVKISNGTKTVELSVSRWKHTIAYLLETFNSDDKSKNQNVWIKVTGKTIEKNPIELSTL